MEINSVRSSQNLHYKNSSNNAKTTKAIDLLVDTSAGNSSVFQIDDEKSTNLDFTSITPGELRSHALQSYQTGTIDQNTYSTLAEPLPTHALDSRGNVLDLTDVTDNTNFNFVDYYQSQLDVASSIGDPGTAQTLQSVVNFLNA